MYDDKNIATCLMRNINWKIDYHLIDYKIAIQQMENHVNLMINQQATDLIWLLEHPSIYTKGSSAKDNDLLNITADDDVISTNRGGQITYHGPGQRIIYPILNIYEYKNINLYIHKLMQWIITTLQHLQIDAFYRDDIVGIFVLDHHQEYKIASIGIRVRKWIAFHGISLNVSTDLSKFDKIVPCGNNSTKITSLQHIKKNIELKRLDQLLKITFSNVFNDLL